MMRTALRPLAHLVDGAAERWIESEVAGDAARRAVEGEIVRSFRIGDQPTVTFHGLRFLLTISQDGEHAESGYRIEVHEIALND